MKLHFIVSALACFAMLVMSSAAVRAADEQMREGTVVSAGGGSLVFTDMAGKQVSFKVPDSVPVTINGHMAKLNGLKAGMRIRVTLNQDEQCKAVNTLDDHKLIALDESAAIAGLREAGHAVN